MKIKPLIAIAGLTAALGLSLAITSADAQGRRGGRGAGEATGAAGPAGLGNPMQLQMQLQMGDGNTIDPAVSAKSTLIYRTDVQNTLSLDLKQKLALDDLKTVQAQNQQKMGQDVRTLMQSLRPQRGQNTTTTTPEEQQQKMQEITDKAKGLAQGYQDDMEKRIDAILTPKQRTRLTEIDLQWRGPLSLVDPKVAAQAALGDDDKKKAAGAYKEFTDARQKLMLAMMPANMRNRLANTTSGATTGTAISGTIADSAPPAAPTLPAVPLTPAEQAAAQKKAQQDFDKSCAAMGVKLVSNLTPGGATAWQGMLGSHFTFRNDN